MTQNELIRFRLTTTEKEQIAAAARHSETSVSALVRRAARDAAAGRWRGHLASFHDGAIPKTLARILKPLTQNDPQVHGTSLMAKLRAAVRESGVSLATIHRAESVDGKTAMTFANASAIRRALENAGVELIEENGGGPGARLKQRLSASSTTIRVAGSGVRLSEQKKVG